MAQTSTVLRMIRYLVWGLVLALTTVMLFVLYSPQKPGLPAIGGPFTMTSMNGERIDTGTMMKGKAYGVFFGFTNCPDICPTTMFELTQMLKAMGDSAKDFRVFFVSVDPERDTPASLKEYLSAFDPRIIGMVGSKEELEATARLFRAFYRKVPTPSGYTMDHTAAIYLYDSKGEIAGTLDMQEAEKTRIEKLRRLLGR